MRGGTGGTNLIETKLIQASVGFAINHAHAARRAHQDHKNNEVGFGQVDCRMRFGFQDLLHGIDMREK